MMMILMTIVMLVIVLHPKNSVILTSKASKGTLARDLQDNGGDRTIPIKVQKRVKLVIQELEQFSANEKKTSSKIHLSLVEEGLDSENDSDEEMEVVKLARNKLASSSRTKASFPCFLVLKKRLNMTIMEKLSGLKTSSWTHRSLLMRFTIM